VVEAFGHEVASVQELGLTGTADHMLIDALHASDLDLILTLDGHRQSEVWSSVLSRLAEGPGRMLRMKIGKRELPTVAVLTRYWAVNYEERTEKLVNDPAYVLVQLGRKATDYSRVRGGVRGYTRPQVAELLQQEFGITPQGDLRARGSPRLRSR
jgi:hypothetical protein